MMAHEARVPVAPLGIEYLQLWFKIKILVLQYRKSHYGNMLAVKFRVLFLQWQSIYWQDGIFILINTPGICGIHYGCWTLGINHGSFLRDVSPISQWLNSLGPVVVYQTFSGLMSRHIIIQGDTRHWPPLKNTWFFPYMFVVGVFLRSVTNLPRICSMRRQWEWYMQFTPRWALCRHAELSII